MLRKFILMKKCLQCSKFCCKIVNCDTLNFPCSFLLGQNVLKHIDSNISHGSEVVRRARDQKEVQAGMNNYELALVVDAKIEDD